MKWLKSVKENKASQSKVGVLTKPIRVADYLSEKTIYFIPPRLPKNEIFQKLVHCLPLPDHAAALNAILEREKAGNTVLESKIAIPHARLQGIGGIQAALGICQEPLQDPLRIYVLFLSPSNDTKTHLLFLASVGSLFQTEDLAAALSKLTDAKDVLKKIQEVELGA